MSTHDSNEAATPGKALSYGLARPPGSLPVLIRTLAVTGIVIGIARVISAVLTLRSLGVVRVGPPSTSRLSDIGTGHLVLHVAGSVILGGALLAASIGIMRDRSWSASLMTFSERCAIAFYLVEAVIRFVELANLRINQYGPPYVLYRVANVLEETVLCLVFPVFALAIIRAILESVLPSKVDVEVDPRADAG